jgi:methylated-DNA-protein-cysteine methyltransferase related protein
VKAFEKVYKVVSKIPKGKVMTYKQVANAANIKTPFGPRIVGFAMNANKDTIKVPCHRVVGSNGKLTGYARGGIEKKKEILEKEGIGFFKNGSINLIKHRLTTIT